jgi:hypothetical protein
MKRISSLIMTAVVGLFVASFANAATVDGSWTTTTPGRNGGADRVTTFKFKADGGKLTGTISNPGRQGGAARETAIEEGKVTGDDISFSVSRDVQGTKMVTKYTGKVTAEEIKGKVETERNGKAQSRDWVAKKAK